MSAVKAAAALLAPPSKQRSAAPSKPRPSRSTKIPTTVQHPVIQQEHAQEQQEHAQEKEKHTPEHVTGHQTQGDTPEEDDRPPPLHPRREALVSFAVERCGLTRLQARDAEIGAYNWALDRAEERRVARNWNSPHFCHMYDSKARSLAANLDPTAYVANDRLRSRIAEGEFAPHDVASMPAENVFPERWRDVVERKVRRDEYISSAKPTAMTDQFRCSRCKKRECSYMELQTRSCDEPATLFIQCLSCGHKWRMG